jgi:hypothetical protein
METSDQILQSDILGMFEARHSRSIKNRDGLLKAGVRSVEDQQQFNWKLLHTTSRQDCIFVRVPFQRR